jgi:hypothetical protein
LKLDMGLDSDEEAAKAKSSSEQEAALKSRQAESQKLDSDRAASAVATAAATTAAAAAAAAANEAAAAAAAAADEEAYQARRAANGANSMRSAPLQSNFTENPFSASGSASATGSGGGGAGDNSNSNNNNNNNNNDPNGPDGADSGLATTKKKKKKTTTTEKDLSASAAAMLARGSGGKQPVITATKSGKLFVHIVQCSGLSGKNPKAYVQVDIENSKFNEVFKTSPVTSNAPSYDEDLGPLRVANIDEQLLRVEVYAKNRLKKDELIGFTDIELQNLGSGQIGDVTTDLENLDGNLAGTIHLTVRLQLEVV